MTATPILEALAKEFSIERDSVRGVLEMLAAGLSAPYIGRVRRAETGNLSESTVRRIERRRDQLEELDRRRGTILRQLEGRDDVPEQALEAIRMCMDRFELEDLFLPHRRPEPEVQLALDRGLGGLADLLVEPLPRAKPSKHEVRASGEEAAAEPVREGEPATAEPAEAAATSAAPETSEPVAEAPSDAPAATSADASGEPGPQEGEAGAPAPHASEANEPQASESSTEPQPGEASPEPQASESGPEPQPGESSPEPQASESAAEPQTGEAAAPPEPQAETASGPRDSAGAADKAHGDGHGGRRGTFELTPQLARVCAGFVSPDRGVHTEREALEGAMRILSDRLGRDARLRTMLRRMMRKHGVLDVRQIGDGKRRGGRKALVKPGQPLRQIQGHRLLAIRQAQKDRTINAHIRLDTARALPRVRLALGRRSRPEFDGVLSVVAERAYERRLLPMIEDDVRLELKERADDEALRLLGQHLRQILLTPPAGPEPVAGVDVNAKGDWTVVLLDREGEPYAAEPTVRAAEPAPAAAPAAAEVERPAPASNAAPAEASATEGEKAEAAAETDSGSSEAAAGEGASPAASDETGAASATGRSGDAGAAPEPVPSTPPAPKKPSLAVRIETRDKDAATLGEELRAALGVHPPRVLAVGHGKPSRAAVPALRAALDAVGMDDFVCIVNDAGLSTYASSELARSELPEHAVPVRMAISLGRRFQDPMAELLKVEPRHLRLGPEQALVSKAALKRTMREVVESCTAHVGCDVNRAPLSVLTNVPGLDRQAARKIVERRQREALQSREELRGGGLLTEAQWTSAIGFLRIPEAAEPFDRTSLHPEQYALARRVIESTGSTAEEVLGRAWATKGLRRAEFGIDEATWRDILREINHPGRDPRPRLFRPAILPVGTSPDSLQKNMGVEGIVFNVTSFGVFVDLGIERDGMIHISEITSRYVRDARELISIGQMVRARVTDPSGQRISLSLKNVPAPPRAPHRERKTEKRGGRGGDRRGPRKERDDGKLIRAARTRRDGLGGASGGREGRRGKGGGGRRPGGRRESRDYDGGFDRNLLGASGGQAGSYSPFANFFRESGVSEGDSDGASQSED